MKLTYFVDAYSFEGKHRTLRVILNCKANVRSASSSQRKHEVTEHEFARSNSSWVWRDSSDTVGGEKILI